LPIPLPEGEIGQPALDALAEGFAAAHQRMYGFAPDDEPVQLVTYRIEAAGVVPKASFQAHKDAGPDASGALMARRDVWLSEAGGTVPCPIYDRERLQSGNRIVGPAIVEQMDATTLVLPATVGHVDPYLNLILETL
jgi:N-methylhydantoinase A